MAEDKRPDRTAPRAGSTPRSTGDRYVPPPKLPKISLGFVIRRCVTELGRRPTPAEFSAWANTAGELGSALFGRRISAVEAEVILRHQARPVTARTARAHEGAAAHDLPDGLRPSADVRDKVVDFAAIRARTGR